MEIGEVQVEQLEAQRAALQDNVPGHVYRNLQNQLQDITRKHNEFAAYIRGLNEFHSSLPEVGISVVFYYLLILNTKVSFSTPCFVLHVYFC